MSELADVRMEVCRSMVLYGWRFTACQERQRLYLRGVKDTSFLFLNWRFGMDGVAVERMLVEFFGWYGKQVRKPEQYRAVIQCVFYSVARSVAEEHYTKLPCVVAYRAHKDAFIHREGEVDRPGAVVFGHVFSFMQDRGYISVIPSPGQLRLSAFRPTAKFPVFGELLSPVVLSLNGVVEMYTEYHQDACWVPARVGDSDVRVSTNDMGDCLVEKRVYREVGHKRVPVESYTVEDAAVIKRVERDIRAFNDEVLGHRFHTYENGEFCEKMPMDAMLHVVYNNSSTRFGGRAYCNFQNLPQRNHDNVADFVPIRSTLHIDGERCAEVDYSSLHYSMLYHSLNLPCPSDCYRTEVPGWEMPRLDDGTVDTTTAPYKCKRGLLKVCALALVNCGDPDGTYAGNRRSAIMTIQGLMCVQAGLPKDTCWRTQKPHDTAKGVRTNRRVEDALVAAGIPLAVTPDVLLEAIMLDHAPISQFFFHGAGSWLQNVDGEIARDVYMEFIREGEAIIPVHDSHLVRASLSQKLVDRMERAYMRHPKLNGFKPVVKVEKCTVSIPAFPAELLK